MKYIAVIEACDTWGGFEWGDPRLRKHHLFSGETPRDVIENVAENAHYVPEWLLRMVEDGEGVDDDDDVIAAVERLYRRADVGIVEAQSAADVDISALPSMGAPCWGDDDWMGLADYRSHQQWAALLGRQEDYILPDPDDMDPAVAECLY